MLASLLAPLLAALRPNVILLLTDDEDALLSNATAYQPALRQNVVSRGLTFARGFANTPVCCPSRSSMLTGKYTHNGGALNNSHSTCTTVTWSETMEPDALAVHLQKAGFLTLYAGKYLNNYGDPHTGAGGKRGLAYVPPGWSEWYALHGNSRYFNYTLSNDGVPEGHGCNATADYLTDVLTRRAVRFVREVSSSAPSRPFFMWIGTPAAHASFTPAPEYVGTAAGELAPRTPNWNVVGNPGHHQSVRELKAMSAEEVAQSDEIYAHRLGTLRSVDAMVGALYDALDEVGRRESTYFFYTSDHGFHLGQNGMGYDKRQLYETDVRVPYYVSGPGVPRGVTTYRPVSHVDLAPTILAIATNGAPTPDGWDGHSFWPLLRDEATAGGEAARTDVLLQYFGEAVVEACGSDRLSYHTTADGSVVAWKVGGYIPAPCDGENNTYTCVRRVETGAALEARPLVDDVDCEFECFAHGPGSAPVPCPADEPEGYGAYYDLSTDPWQMKNLARSLAPAKAQMLRARLERLRSCRGQEGCA